MKMYTLEEQINDVREEIYLLKTFVKDEYPRDILLSNIERLQREFKRLEDLINVK